MRNRALTILGLPLLAFTATTTALAQTGPTQMPWGQMTWGMVAVCVLGVIVLVLGAAALIKYLFFR